MVLRLGPVLLAGFSIYCFAPARVVAEQEADPEWSAFSAAVQADFHGAAEQYLSLLEKQADGPLSDYFFFKTIETAGRAGRAGEALSRRAMEIVAKSGNWCARAQADWIRANRRLRSGKTAEAENTARGLGLLRDWAVIGPFENEGEAGFKEVYGPEKDLETRTGFMDYSAVHEGKQGKNRWRVPGPRHPLFLLDLSRLFRLSEDVCAYAATYIHVEGTTDVGFRLGTDGAVKVWVNGRSAHAGDTYRTASLDQDVFPARLTRGWNEILVKVCQKKGPWSLLFRVTAPDGSPAVGLEVSPDPPAADGDAERAVQARDAHADVERGAVGALAKASGEDPSALTLARHATMLLVRCALDENDRTARKLLVRAVEKAPKSPFLRLMLSSEEIDRNRALAQALEARRLAPDAALPAYALSRFYGAPRPIQWSGWFFWFGGSDAAATQEEYSRIREVEMPGKERELLEEAIRAQPDFVEAHKALGCHVYRRAGGDVRKTRRLSLGRPFALEAKRILEDVLVMAGKDARISKILDTFGQAGPKDRIKRARWYLKDDFTDGPSRRSLVKDLLTQGRVEEAVGVLGDRIRVNPFDWEAYKEMASAYRAFDSFQRAIGCLEMARIVCPENVEILKELGDLYLIEGNTEKSLAVFRRALEIRPQMAKLSKRVRHLTPEAKEEFFKDFRVDLGPIVRAALADTPTEKVPAVVYFKHDVIRILPNGTAKHFHQRVVKVLTEKGVNENRWVSAWPGRYDYYAKTRGEVKEAKIFRADGSRAEGSYREGSTYASFDDLKEGDVFVFEVKAEEVGEPRYKGYFGLMLLLQDGTDPVRDSSVTFIYPEEKPLYFHAVGVDSSPEEKKAGELHTRTWTLRNIPEVKEEFNMPGLFELCPYVHASTFRTWEEVSIWYSNLVKDQFESSEEIRKTVARITAGLSTNQEKVDALFRFMVSDIRYESLDLADHAYRPFKARHTFDRKYGDCKDTATLFKTMLKEAGIESHVVLIRAGMSERIALELPSMKIFNHAIAFVPGVGPQGKGLLMDGTARYCGSRELPEMDQGAVAFIVGLGGTGKAIYTPYDEPVANLNRSQYTVRLSEDGSASVTAKTLVRGQEAYEFRSEYQKGTKRKEEMERRLNRAFQSASVNSVTFSDLSDYNKSVEYEVEFKVPALARSQDRVMALRPVLDPCELCSRFAMTDTRYHDLILGHPRRTVRTVEILLPEGWSVRHLPAGHEISNDMAGFKLTFEASPAKVVARVEFELRAPRISRDKYPEFRRFCEEVDRVEEEELVLERK